MIEQNLEALTEAHERRYANDVHVVLVILGARAAARVELVGRGGTPAGQGATADAVEPAAASGEPAESAGGRNRSWAVLMQRTFGLDVVACPRCGGRLRLIALIEQTAVIKRVLGHLGLPHRSSSGAAGAAAGARGAR